MYRLICAALPAGSLLSSMSCLAERPTRAHLLTGRLSDCTCVLFKLLADNLNGDTCELHDLIAGPDDVRNRSSDQLAGFVRIKQELLAGNWGMGASSAEKEYPKGRVSLPEPELVNWYESPRYHPSMRSGNTQGTSERP